MQKFKCFVYSGGSSFRQELQSNDGKQIIQIQQNRLKIPTEKKHTSRSLTSAL